MLALRNNNLLVVVVLIACSLGNWVCCDIHKSDVADSSSGELSKLFHRSYDGMSETEIQKNDAYRQANPFFEQCIERADRLSGEFGVTENCGNIMKMTKCTPACKKSFESYFRTLTTGCWVEIIVGLDRLHPAVAAHWKAFGEKVDSLCYHPPKPKKKRRVVPKKILPKKEVDEEEEQVGPNGVDVVKDDFSFPNKFSDGLGGEFPDRLIPAESGPSRKSADVLPWRRQRLQGRIGRILDKTVKALPLEDGDDKPDMSQPHIGPEDSVISYDAEREKGILPGQDIGP